jgi:hypothetical protein
MKRTVAIRARRLWTRLAATAVPIAVLFLAACSPTHEPESQGSISLVIYIENEAGGDVAGAPAQVFPDSAVVRVFRGGSGVLQETHQGVAINGASQVDVTVTCSAETGKKVSVELFAGETMVYFGVDESVDVVEDENTDVTIDAYDIRIDDLEVTDPLIEPGDPPLDVFWDRVPVAASYLLLESSSPNFEQHLTQSFLTTDTVMTRNRPPGPWYYTVAPLNQYATGSLSNIAYAYVVSVGEPDPRIDDMTPQEVVPGDRVTLSGQNLNVPGRVWVGTVICPVVSASETELEFVVPAATHTGAVSFENLMNTTGAPGILVVDRIAYVTRTDRDVSDSQWYIDLVKSENSLTSGVAVVALDEVADRDMRVFDVIIVAHDVGTGVPGTGWAQLSVIAESGAHVMAIGRGGQTFISLAISDFNGVGFTRESRQDLYFPDGSLTLLQSPHQIAQDGVASVQVMSNPAQWFTGFDIDVPLPSVTTYARLSETGRPASHVLLDAVVNSQFHNIYWGYEGDPNMLTSLGRDCVANIIVYLIGAKTSVPAEAPARALR